MVIVTHSQPTSRITVRDYRASRSMSNTGPQVATPHFPAATSTLTTSWRRPHKSRKAAGGHYVIWEDFAYTCQSGDAIGVGRSVVRVCVRNRTGAAYRVSVAPSLRNAWRSHAQKVVREGRCATLQGSKRATTRSAPGRRMGVGRASRGGKTGQSPGSPAWPAAGGTAPLSVHTLGRRTAWA